MKNKIDTKLEITRVANACVLIKIGNDHILTDPFFHNPFYMGIDEEVALEVEQLPLLSAIIGCHSVPDHWQISSLSAYPHKDKVPIYVATKSMAKKARSAGFRTVEIVEWGEQRSISKDLNLETVEAQKVTGFTVNNYVLRGNEISIFFGSEARDLQPLRKYRNSNEKVDVVLLPVNAVHLFGFLKLVMGGDEAVEATKILGAKFLFVIHDAHQPRPLLVGIRSSGDDADTAAKTEPGIEVVRVPTGETWTPEFDDH